MNIVSLNAWGGIAGVEGLVAFFEKYQDIDVFCLQEIFDGGEGDPTECTEKIEAKVYDLLSRIKQTLPNHVSYFRPHLKDHYGLALFVKKDIELLEEGEVFIHKEKGYIPQGISMGHHARNLQYVKVVVGSREICIANVHGLWNGQGKTDTDDRLAQSENIARFIEGVSSECVLCGDFNLRPDTESIKIIEGVGLRNLIKEYGILSTRTSHYTKPEKFADYAFVTKGIVVKDFKILPEEVSDHAPLYIEI